MAVPRHMPRHPIRRAVQVSLLILCCLTPWLGWFRLDIQDETVTYFGTTYPMQMPYILGFIIFFLLAVWGLAGLSYFKGRVFCGWACPYGTCIELFEGLKTALWKGTHRKVAAWMRRSAVHRWGLRVGALATIVAVPPVLALSLAAYIQAPDKILRILRTPMGHGGTAQTALWVWMGFMWTVSLLAGFMVRFHFCRYVCIYGMGQAMVASTADARNILRPRFLPASTEACGGCQACLKACFVDLDPREKRLQLGFGSGCFNCGDCLDVCATVQAHRGNVSLLSFQSGSER